MSNELKEWIENSHHIVFFGGARASPRKATFPISAAVMAFIGKSSIPILRK